MIAISKRIGRAMAIQVERVNDRASVDLEAEVARLRQQLAEAQRQIAGLRERVAAFEAEADGPIIVNGRPALSARQAAARVGVSLATVSRYLTSGHWQGSQDLSGRWFVYADQALRRKQRA